MAEFSMDKLDADLFGGNPPETAPVDNSAVVTPASPSKFYLESAKPDSMFGRDNGISFETIKESAAEKGVRPEELIAMSGLKPIASLPPVSPNVIMVDADTFETRVNGQKQRVRLPGVDALETQHGFGGGGDFGGLEVNEKLIQLYKQKGFTEPVVTDIVDETGTRLIGDLQDPVTKTKASDFLLYNQLAVPTIQSTPDQINTYVMGSFDKAMRKIDGRLTPQDKLSDDVFEAIGKQGFRVKPLAVTEADYAVAPEFYRGVGIRDFDRTMLNEAASTMITGITLGGLGIAEGAYGALEMLGDIFDADSLSKYGKAHGDKIRREIEGLPYLKNQSAFDEEGNWTLNGLGDTAQFVYSNAMASAPYLAMSVVSALTGGIPLVGLGLAVGTPATVFAGQIYSEQEEKNPAAAIGGGIGMSMLDRLGLQRLAGKMSTNIFEKSVREKMVDAVMESKPYLKSRKMAEMIVSKQLKGSIKDFSATLKTQLAQEVAYKQLLKSTPTAFAQGMISEGLTESAQEIIQYVASNTPESFDLQTMNERALNGLVAGAALGGAFKSVGNLSEFAMQRDKIRGQMLREKPLSLDMDLQEDERKRRGGSLRSVSEVTEDLSRAAAQSENDETIGDFTSTPRTTSQSVVEYFKAQGIIGGLLGQSLRQVAKKYAKKVGKNGTTHVRDLFSSLGALKVNGSDTDEIYNQEREAYQMSLLLSEEEAIQQFGVNNTQEVSDIMYDDDVQSFTQRLMNNARLEGASKLSTVADNTELRGKYADKKDAIVAFTQGVFLLERERNLKPDQHLLKNKVLDKGKVANNKDKFISLLMERGLSPDAAKEATELFIDTVDATTITDLTADDLNMLADDTANSAALKELAVSELRIDPIAFDEFFADNVFFNLFSDIARSAASDTYRRFYGENGKKLVGILKQAVAEGEITMEEAKDIAYQLKDYMKVRTGQLGRIQNERLRRLQDNLLLVTTLNALPLATVSSLVEMSLVTRMLTKDQIYKMLSKAGHALGLEIGNYINEIASKAKLTQRKDFVRGERVNLRRAGYLLQGQSSKQRSGLNPESSFSNRILNGFFKGIGLEALTNFLRTLRLAIAGDAISGFLDIVEGSRSYDNDTIEIQEARQALIDINVNPDELIALRNRENELIAELELNNVDPNAVLDGQTIDNPSVNFLADEFIAVNKEYNRVLVTASINFTDVAVANPRAGNRPFFYSNKKFAMLTTFQGFISSFTANILPNIYKGLIARKVSTNIDSVRTIALLITLGFAVQALRDMIKYEDGETPEWIDDDEKLQRAIYSSGLLGSTERLVDMAFPLYPQRSDGLIDGAYTFAEGEMPAVAWVSKVAKAFEKGYEGDIGGAAKYAYRSLPGVGPDYRGAQKIESLVDNLVRGEE